MNAAPGAIIQVVPGGGGGVRDYAQCLAQAWSATGTRSCIIEAPVQAPDAARLLGSVERAAESWGVVPHVLLHFSGYGYAQGGLCFWLVEFSRVVRTRRGSFAGLAIMFHELFATSVPWRSAFWLGPAQRRIAASLARLADRRWTNAELHARWLRQASGADVQSRPVFSNVGEPAAVGDFQGRRDALVAFGSAGTRLRLARVLARKPRLLNALRAFPLLEVGPGAPALAPLWPATLATAHGALPPAQVSAILQSVRYGLIEYPGAYLSKSGVFAAYAAHGLAVVNGNPAPAGVDGLCADVQYLSGDRELALDVDDARRVAGQLHAWYQGHTLASQACAWARELQPGNASKAVSLSGPTSRPSSSPHTNPLA